MATISRTRIETDLAPFLLTRIDKGVVDLLGDEDYINLYNNVANDLNERAELNIERFYKKTGSDTAEDSSYTNYLTQGVVLKVLEFIYNGTDWETQAYCFANDRIFLKTAPATGVQLDVHYLRECEAVSAGSDEIDLPSNVHPDYLELLKVKLQVDYGNRDFEDYERSLEYFSQKARLKVKDHYLRSKGNKRYWMGQTGDDSVYDITGQWIGLDNFLTDSDGDYYYTGD